MPFAATPGATRVNVAHADRVEAARVGPVQIENPAAPQDIARLVEAVAEAEEISTAVPSVRFYTGPGPGSIHRILAQGLRKKAAAGGPRAVVYAAENHNHAAEILEAAVFDEIPAAEKARVRERVRFLNTVIGKMSGVIADAGEAQARHLATVTPGQLPRFSGGSLQPHPDFASEFSASERRAALRTRHYRLRGEGRSAAL